MKVMGMHHLGMSLVAVGLLSSGIAHASGLTPVDSVFEGMGAIKLSAGPYSGTCSVTLFGDIDPAGAGKIDGDVSEFSGTSRGCAVIRGSGSWAVLPTSATTLEIRDVRVNGPFGIYCSGTLDGTLIGGRLSLYQVARSVAREDDGAGTVLLHRVIADALDSGCHEVDFLRGDEAYKASLADERRTVGRIRLARGPVARTVLGARTTAGALRRRLDRSV